MQILIVRAKHSAVKQGKSHRYYTLTIFSLWALMYTFSVFLVSNAHAFRQPGENAPARFLDQGYIPRSIIHIGADKDPTYVIIVEKASQQLFILAYGRTIQIKHTFPCSTGINKGNKNQAGDQRTPVGVYFFTQKFSPKDLSPTYGRLAFPIDYPNFLDKLEGRDGNSIWIHGTNKPLKPRDSNGCVVMNNDDIQMLSEYIKLNRTPILIKDKIEWVPMDQISDEKEGLLSFLNAWERAFEQKNRNLYRSYYEDEATVHGPLWDKWEILQKKWEDDTRRFDLHLKDPFLLRQGHAVIALFDETVTLSDNSLVAGTKKLYLTKHDNHRKIIGETWQLPTNNDRVEPRLAALEKLDQRRDENRLITELIEGWIAAWSEKDLERYIAYYADDFRSRNMNRSTWKQYKERLNKLYGPITITFQDLQIKPKGDKRVVTFLQTYRASKSDSSNGYQAIGMKRLFLKRVGNDWKIYRETWGTP